MKVRKQNNTIICRILIVIILILRLPNSANTIETPSPIMILQDFLVYFSLLYVVFQGHSWNKSRILSGQVDLFHPTGRIVLVLKKKNRSLESSVQKS